MKPTALLLTCAALTLVTACGKPEKPAEPVAAATPADAAPPPVDTPPPTEPPTGGATVQLGSTRDHTATGTLTLTAEANGVRVTGSLQGLKPDSEFGFHIHEKGDCSAPDASSAGGHFNPGNAQHGDPQGATHHGGDMPNAKSDAQGMAQVDAVASGVSLTAGAADDVHGKAIVVHEKADDYKTQPSGNSGARIACGVIR